MIINALTESEDFERCIREQRWITAEPHDSRRCANPVCSSPGSFATPQDINYRWSLWQQTISKSHGQIPGEVCQKTWKCTNAPVSGEHFCYKSPTFRWVPLGLPGGLPPGLAAESRIKGNAVSAESSEVLRKRLGGPMEQVILDKHNSAAWYVSRRDPCGRLY